MLFIPDEVLNSFGDVLLLRDPRGRSIFRSIHRVRMKGPDGRSHRWGLGVTGPFVLHQVYTISRDQGVTFVEATGDENPIHREGDIVPGAMTAARAVSLLEALFPCLGIRHFKMKFISIARYGVPSRQQLAVSLEGDRMSIRVRIEQAGKEVAQGRISGKLHPAVRRPNVGKWRVNKEELRRVQDYFRALAIPPDLYLLAGNERNYSYPRGFLASLPSGEMVRRLSGEGGYLTTLDLTFPEGPPPPISGAGRPEVSLQTAHKRPTFWKILTQIKQGVEEHCRGFALVFSPQPAGA